MTGDYSLEFNVGSPNNTGLGVNVYVDGVLLNTTDLSGTGGWETYVTQSGSDSITISEGTHTIRFESTSPTTWQWNADWFSLTFEGTLSVGNVGLSDVSLFPNPTRNDVIINGLKGDSTITIFTVQGHEVAQVKTSKEKITINLSNYAKGIFLIRVMQNESGSTNLYKIIKE